ncbi:MAG TPA: hypothetical protein VG937_32945 [Polyangiaceae bacterium]|jgi:hypothetical protein|nr:hypothetical protein [Polyangiaceae bacterium]
MTPREPDAERRSPSERPVARRVETTTTALAEAASGVSPSVFATLALVAMLAARGVAPALPGSATGIADLITVTSRIAACTSQLVAAGGVVLCIRLMSAVFGLPSLGVAFRFAMLPVGLGVIALVAAAIARPLEPDLGKVLAIAAVVASASTAPFLLGLRWARGPGVVLLCTALSGVLALFACELARRAGKDDSGQALFALAATLFSISSGLVATIVAVVWATQTRKRLAITVFISLAVTLLLMTLARAGENHAANAGLVLLHRSLEALSQQPPSMLPQELGEIASLVQLLFASALLLLPGRSADVRAALTLCLIGGMTAGAPVAALLSVASALLLATTACDPQAAPEPLPLKISN